MAYFLHSRQLWRLVVITLLVLSSSVAAHEVESQWNFASEDVMTVERNASITLFPNINICPTDTKGPHCDKYLRNNFTLAPEVCLSGLDPHMYFLLLEMPKCVSRDGESPAVLITYADEKCTGLAKVQPGQHSRMWVEFPFDPRAFTLTRWSLIFHCHSEPFDEISDPFERVYTIGEKLQDPPDPPEPQGPLGLCEPWLPRLTDGWITFTYEGCSGYGTDPWKWYNLPVNICQSASGGNTLKIDRPGVCPDGSRAQLAQYWDDICKELHVIDDIKDEDLAWDACRFLNGTRSIAFYCDGFGGAGAASDRLFDVKNGKETTLLEPTPKLQLSPLPRKPWVPFWKGLLLIDAVANSPGDRYISPRFEDIDADTCYTEFGTLKIYQVPRCFNGRRAKVAFFTWARCRGSPVFYDSTDERLFETLINMGISCGYGSLVFWCSGKMPYG